MTRTLLKKRQRAGIFQQGARRKAKCRKKGAGAGCFLDVGGSAALPHHGEDPTAKH